MAAKTDVELRKGLESLDIYSEEEVEAKVADALEKGSVTRFVETTPDPVAVNIAALDALADGWDELVKGPNGDDEPPEGGEEEPEPEEEPEEEEDENESAKAGAAIVAKALTATLSRPLQALATKLSAIESKYGNLSDRINYVGTLAKGMVVQMKQDLAKGTPDNGRAAILARLSDVESTLMKAITEPRGDFRGLRASDFGSVPYAGDKQPEGLAKGAIDVKSLTDFMLVEQKKARQSGDSKREEALYKAISHTDKTTSNDELAQYAAQFGFPQ